MRPASPLVAYRSAAGRLDDAAREAAERRAAGAIGRRRLEAGMDLRRRQLQLGLLPQARSRVDGMELALAVERRTGRPACVGGSGLVEEMVEEPVGVLDV